MNPVEWVRQVLLEVSLRIPPAPPTSHGIGLLPNGRLSLTVKRGEEWLQFLIDPEDGEKSPVEVAAEIAKLEEESR